MIVKRFLYVPNTWMDGIRKVFFCAPVASLPQPGYIPTSLSAKYPNIHVPYSSEFSPPLLPLGPKTIDRPREMSIIFA